MADDADADALQHRIRELESENARLKNRLAEQGANEARFQAIVNAMQEGYFEVDLKGDCTYFSPAIPKIFGFPEEEILGMNNRAYTAPETAKKMFRIFNRVYRTGEPAEITDYEIIRKNGTRRYLELSAYLITDASGQPAGFRGLCRDVTDRKMTEKALAESDQKYRQLYKEAKRAEEIYQSLLNSSPDAIVIYNTDQTVRYLNPVFTEIFGWTLDELLDRPIDNVPDKESESARQMFDNLCAESRPLQGVEARRKTRDGDLRDVSISAACFQDYQGEPAGVLMILRDITEAKKLRRHLQQAQKMESIGTLAGGVAHDFNNLLMGMQGRLSLMMFDLSTNHSHYRHVREIESYVKRAAELTQQLLGFARGGKYEVVATDINELIGAHDRMFGRTRKDIAIHEDFSADLSAVEVDQRQIEQVLLNMYVNAGHAMADGGNLYVATRQEKLWSHRTLPHDAAPGEYIKISITDTGVGMEEPVRRRVFEPFFTTREMGRGTGLGLASAYGIVKNHYGFITVYSEPGKGTTFNIYLPASRKTPQAEISAEDQIVSGTGTVLLVDDEAMVIEVGEELLESLGYRVKTAASGTEAIETYKAERGEIDLVILDMIMPGVSGGETFDALKAVNPEVKILLASGYSINGQAADILERGCDGFIQKPFNLLELSRKVAEILSGSGSGRQKAYEAR